MALFKKKTDKLPKLPPVPPSSPNGTQQYMNDSGYIRMTHPGIKVAANAESRAQEKRSAPKQPKKPKVGRGARP